MSGCIDRPAVIIEKLRAGFRNGRRILCEDDELRSFCVASKCKKLREEIRADDFDLVKWMLEHDNCHLANLGQALLRPFIDKFDKKDEIKSYLIDKWKNTKNDSLKCGLLFDLFLYNENDLSAQFINMAFKYLKEKECVFSQMIIEWLEGKENILDIIPKHISENRDNNLKTALWLFSLVSVYRDKPAEVKKILGKFETSSSTYIKDIVKYLNKKIAELANKDESSKEVEKKWLGYLGKLKQSLVEGANSVLGDDNDIKIFINMRNRHLSYQMHENCIQGIPHLQWGYVGLVPEDIMNADNDFKKVMIDFLSVGLFGGGFLSPEFKLEDYIKVIPLENYFSHTDKIEIDNTSLKQFIESFIKAKKNIFGEKHPIDDVEERCLRQILKYELDAAFPDNNETPGESAREKWDLIMRLAERRFLFDESWVKNGITIMLAVTFGAYYPMDVFVTLKPKNSNQNNLVKELKDAINSSNIPEDEKLKAISFWKLSLNESSRSKVIHLERAFSQVVTHLFTEIYALYFQHFIVKDKTTVVKNGLSVMLGAPIKPEGVQEINSKDFNYNKWLAVERKDDLRVKVGNLLISLPYPTHLDPMKKYKEITRFKVKELLTKLDEYYTSILNEQKKLRMKDAVVAIMGRNMSHNIGSHVLWHLGEDLTLDPEKLEMEKNKDEKEKTQTKIKNFYSYLRERMGFIALIATERPSWAVERLLKTAVDHFSEMDLLQNNIVLTEKLIENGEEYRFNPIVQLDSKSKERLIEFPHGSYGEQALYIILENIIRNTIKHNRHKLFNDSSNGDIPINFVLSVTEPDEPDWKQDYWKVTIRDDLQEYSESLEELVKKLQEKADENIFDDLGKPKRTNLGFKEKRVCAAFLRMIPQEEIDSAELKSKISKKEIPPLLTIDKWKNKNNETEHLAHIIYLRKPKKALLISENEWLLNNNNIQLLEEKGFYITHKDEAKMLLNTNTMNYKFLVLMLNDELWAEEFVKKHYIKLPHRILSTKTLSTNRPYVFIEYNDINSNFSNPDALYSLFWEKWLNYFGNPQKIKVYIIESSKQNSLKNIPTEYYQVVDKQFNNYNESPPIILSHDKEIDSDFFKKVFACEGYSGTEGVGGLIEMLSKPEFSYLYWQLLESFLWKIVVIDERIFGKKDIERTPPKFRTKLSVETLWNKRGVKILDPEKFIEGDWSEIDKPHILILHQGVIDKYNESHKEQEGFETKWEKEIKEQIPYLVVDSDRGKPDGVERLGAIWIQFSDLGDIMVHKAENSLSKYLLVDILTSLRGGKGR